MTDTTSPEGTVEASPMTFDQGASAIESLLGNPGTDLSEDDEAVQTKEAPKTEATDDVVDDEDADLVLDTDDEDEPVDDTTDAPVAITDDTPVTLEDGKTISLGELKRNNLFQRDYTRKTEELSRERKQAQEWVASQEADIRQKREFIMGHVNQFMPKEPSASMLDPNHEDFDPISYHHEKAQFEAQMGNLNRIYQQQQEEQRQQSEAQKEQHVARLAEEKQKLSKVLPKLATKEGVEAFTKDIADYGIPTYGIAPEEISQIEDARYMQILHDAIQYRKLKAKSVTAVKTVEAKPQFRPKQRMSQNEVRNRDRAGRFENVRQTGSVDAAASYIETLID